MSGSMLVKIKNYQRIRQAKLEFIPGLNVIVGQSNNGKSAIIRAIETAIYNISREGHVTLGETKSLVGIQYNGHEVIWRRDTDSASQVTYRVDGKVYSKLGKGQPQVVKDALGIFEVEINDRKFKVNFSKQMAYPFLLDSTPSELFKFIVQSSEEDNVIDVLNTMRSDVNEIASNVKKYEEARNELGKAYNREVQKFKQRKPLIPYCSQIIEMDSDVKKLKALKDSIETYEKCKYVITKSTEDLEKIESVKDGLVSQIEELRKKIESWVSLKKTVDDYESIIKEISVVEEELKESKGLIYNLSDLDLYKVQYEEIEVKSVRQKELSKTVQRYETLQLDLNVYNEDLEIQRRLWGAYQSIENDTSKLISEIEEKSEESYILRKTLKDYEDSSRQISSANEDIDSLRQDVEDIQKEIEGIGVCPYCGNELKGEHKHDS